MTRPTVLICFVIYIMIGVSLARLTVEQELKRHLFPNDFDPSVRPVLNSTDNVTVFVDMSLNHLVDLNEKLQILQTEIAVRLTWKDPQLTWTPEDFNNIQVIHVFSDKVWTPDIVIFNDVGFESVREPKDFLISLTWDGKVQWLYPQTVETSCKMDVALFPYDTQECPYTFGSWAVSGDMLDVRNSSKQGGSDTYIDNGEWRLLRITAERQYRYFECCSEPFPLVTFTLELQRRSLYYVYHLVGPCILITLLHLTSFLLPAESGEKVSLNVTILLGLTVFLLLVAELMPPQSEVIPIIGLYFGFCILIVSLSTALSVLILHIHFRGARGFQVPGFIRTVIVEKLGYLLCYGGLIEKKVLKQGTSRAPKRISAARNEGNVELISVIPSSSNSTRRNVSKDIGNEPQAISTVYLHDNYTLNCEGKSPMEDLGVLHSHFELKEDQEKTVIQDWIIVSLILDRFFFVLFSIADIATIVFVIRRMFT